MESRMTNDELVLTINILQKEIEVQKSILKIDVRL